jgi:hypothetical protein
VLDAELVQEGGVEVPDRIRFTAKRKRGQGNKVLGQKTNVKKGIKWWGALCECGIWGLGWGEVVMALMRAGRCQAFSFSVFVFRPA